MESPKIKVIFLGRPGVGKTTLRKIFFDQQNPLKLLKQTFEPTLGAETQVYNFGMEIAVHDLAGQELKRWLTTDDYILEDTDVFILVLAATDEWEENMELFDSVQEIFRNKHISTTIAVFFHKIDLLTANQLTSLQKKIVELRKTAKFNTDFFTTSIQQKYLYDTFYAFIRALKASLYKIRNLDYYDFFIKVELIRYFITHDKAEYKEIEERLHIKPLEILAFINVLYKDGLLKQNKNLKTINVTEKGLEILEQIDNAFIPNVKEVILAEKNYIKGVILAEKSGIPFYTYEYSPGFFNSLITDKRSASEPGIISMFFAQILQFGQTMDYKGLNSFYLSGHNLRIVSRSYQNLMGIFLIDRIEMDQGIWKYFLDFMRNLSKVYGEKLHPFIDQQKLITDSELQTQLTQDIQYLDMVLKSHHQNKTHFSKKKLLEMYINLMQEEKDSVTLSELQSILFQYLIMESPESLREI
ncbi:ADP-ribosylation factor-like protein [Candidatus Harpocratesius sp.]